MNEPERGDLLEIHWVDICEDSVGNPTAAMLSRRTSYGLFWERKDNLGVPCLVTTTTIDKDVDGQSGWCIYPIAAISKLVIVRKVRKPRAQRLKVEVRSVRSNMTPDGDRVADGR